MNENNLDAASNLAKWRYDQTARIHSAPVMAQYYIASVRNGAPIKAGEIANELKTILRLVEKSTQNVERYASRLDDENKPFESLLFYCLAIHYCDEERDVNILINVLVRSCGTMAAIVRKETENNTLSALVISRHIIPYLRKAKVGIARRLMVNREKVAHALATSLYCIEQCEDCVKNNDGRESALKEAISILEDNLKSNAQKHKLYGVCWNNLGHAYLMKQRFNDATRCFQKAIAAKKNAQDYGSVADKIEDIKRSERGLAVARSGECVIQ